MTLRNELPRQDTVTQVDIERFFGVFVRKHILQHIHTYIYLLEGNQGTTHHESPSR